MTIKTRLLNRQYSNARGSLTQIERNVRNLHRSRYEISLLIGLLLACSRSPTHGSEITQTGSAPQPRGPASTPIAQEKPRHSAASLPPLAGHSWLEELTTKDGQVAFVAPPLAAREPRPIIVGVHGAGDRPEWSCGGWRLASSSFAFVVCPRGNSTGGERFAWASGKQIRARAAAAISEVRERFGKYVSDAPPIYAGFSQGATFAREAVLDPALKYQAVIFAEGGYELQVNKQFALQLHAHGTRRMLLVCGNPSCFNHGSRAETILEQAGIDTLQSGDPRSGHNLNERMQVALRKTWPEFVRDLNGWATFGTR